MDAREKWYREVVADHQDALLRYATRMTGCPERAADAVQETFLRLVAKDADAPSWNGNLRAWLYKVTRSRVLDGLRKEGRMTAVTEETKAALDAKAAALVPGPGEIASGRETRSRLLEALSALPPLHREVVRLRFQENLTYQEIATVVGKTRTHVGVMLHEGLRKLRVTLAHPPAQGNR